MTQSGTYNPESINDVTLEVYVNDVLREHERVEFAGDTPGGLPSQVASTGTGMLSRTGTITWAAPGGLMREPHHPLRQEDGWPPRKGDKVRIDAIVNGVRFRRFTGRLGKTDGGLHTGSLQSEITDTLGDHLGELVNIYPRLPEATGQAYRTAWEALEQCRLGLLPRPEDGPGATALHSTPQGDSWATIGDTNIGAATSTRDLSAGLDLWSGLTGYPDDSVPRGGNSILVIARGSTQHNSHVRMRLTDDTTFQLDHDLDGTLRMYVNESLVRTATWEGEGVPILAFAVTFGYVYIYTSPTYHLASATAVYNAKALRLSGSNIAATHLRYLPDTRATEVVSLCPMQPAALRLPTTAPQNLRASRGFENVQGKSVVDAWGESVLASVWMDEFGQTEVCSRAVMVSRPTARTVRLSERAFSGSWTLGEDDVYSSVVVVGERPAVRVSSSGYRVTIFKDTHPRGFEGSTTEERFVEADTEVDWGPIDITANDARDYWQAGLSSPLEGTWKGSVVTDRPQDNEYWSAIYGVVHNLNIERLGQRTLKLTESVSKIPSGQAVYMKVPSVGTGIDRAVRGQPTPFIRAQWITTWARFTRRAGGGPAYGPILEHNVDWWLTPTDAQKLANALASEITKPMATFSSTSLLWDPRRQVGDVERWVAQDGDGEDAWVAKVLIVGYRESWDGNVPTQSVDARVISMSDPNAGKTYKDLAEAYLTYSNIMASNGTYSGVYNALPNAF